MRYPGGKGQIGQRIAEMINPYSGEREYVEPFCGMCSVGQYVEAKSRLFLDVNAEVIALWSALQNGFVPPSDISEEQYRRIRDAEDAPPELRAFVGFGCSFAGKYFGGYARDSKGGNYAKRGAASLLKKIQKLRTATFRVLNYTEFVPCGDSVIYADPPYENTTQAYGDKKRFDSTEFWRIMNDWSATCIVFVSGYEAPSDWTIVLERTKSQNMGTKEQRAGKTRTEKVFRLL